jgi:heme/copper-type cytochrome/quinol oxidase subunit 2
MAILIVVPVLLLGIFSLWLYRREEARTRDLEELERLRLFLGQVNAILTLLPDKPKQASASERSSEGQ